jgi:CheY-like chemotaxis protein
MPPKRTILFVDDDEDDQLIVCQTIMDLDPSVTIVQAHDGIEALNQLESMRWGYRLPCLIILDINMPKMDGKQTLVAIKQDEAYKNIPVVLFTTSSNPLDRLFGERFGAKMITKPPLMSELRTTVEEMLQSCA